MIPTFLHTKSQTFHSSTHATVRAISFKIGTGIEIAIEKPCYNFQMKIVIYLVAAASENILPFHPTKLDF